MRNIEKIIIHCSATKPNQDIGAFQIDKWHKKRGWSGIGYHFVIRRNGEIENGRPVEEIGAHCQGHNRDSIGICLIGGVDNKMKPENNFTDNQFESLRLLVKDLKEKYNILLIFGHNEFSNKACPCFDVQEFFKK